MQTYNDQTEAGGEIVWALSCIANQGYNHTCLYMESDKGGRSVRKGL